ncbi:MAG: entericidin A/B family lipoprotein [Alphaproteobacteria bacterium]|nr:entericidin A/B family lipoprotein [Alphaproteobacteria bacterium]
MLHRLLIALGLLASLSACNTIAGAGKDIEAAGEAISDTAEDTKEEITN